MSKLLKKHKLMYVLFPISATINFILSFFRPHTDYGNGIYSYGFPSPFLIYRDQAFYHNLNSNKPFSFNIDLLQLLINVLLTYFFMYIVYKFANLIYVIIKGR